MTGKKVLVVGLGKSGKSACEVLKKLGAQVYVYDKKKYVIGEDSQENVVWVEKNGFGQFFGVYPEDMSIFDMIVVSPGVSPELEFIQDGVKQGAELIGELELAYRFGKGTYIAITGTNGKTTTTMLVGEIFKNAGKKTEIVGNVGVAVSSKAMEVSEDTIMVTECSSFQLETAPTFKPMISALLNVTPDHLDRHKTMENYGNIKGRIFANQDESQYFIVNADDPEAVKQTHKCKAIVVPFSRKRSLNFGCFVSEGQIVIKERDGMKIPICDTQDILLQGPHNLENCLAATAICYFYGLEPEEIAETLITFEPIEHRMEFAAEKNGIRFINDSKGTNPEASIQAIRSFEHIVLIAGGYDKKMDFSEYVAAFKGHVDALIIMGETAYQIREAAEKTGFSNIHDAKDMKEAVTKAKYHAKKGSTVLLSPACASWDQYASYEDRGNDFKNCVKEL